MTPAELSRSIAATVAAVVADEGLAVAVPETVTVERPKNKEHGDYATNVALQLAKPAGRPPRQLAELIATKLEGVNGIASVDIAGPGFLNITLDVASQGELARTIVNAGAAYGHTDTLRGQRFNLEFISANPTGPLHLGHTRWAAVGDAIGRVLAAAGAEVTREFYVNDRGVQMDRFGASLEAAAVGQPVPADGYHGDYIHDLAKEIIDTEPGVVDLPEPQRLVAFREAGYRLQLDQQRRSSTTSAPTSTFGTPSGPCTTQAPSSAGSRGCASWAMCMRPTARCGCAPPTSATTKTARWSRATANSPTSPPTPLTTSTSGRAASTCASTCSAPTITATSRG